MRKLILSFAFHLIFLTSYSQGYVCLPNPTCPQTGCIPNHIPRIPDYSDCDMIEKQLARTMSMDGLWRLGSDNTWMGYDEPVTYCDLINYSADNNIRFIRRGGGVWNCPPCFADGDDRYEDMCQMVCDINAAYDCRGLTRPIIQGTIFEIISGRTWSDIPVSYLNDPFFRDQIIGTIWESIYYTANGNPKVIEFEPTRMHFNPPSPNFNGNVPDISKVETQMWFYFVAKKYIDCGFLAIHMGQIDLWAESDSDLSLTSALLDKLRLYATSIGSFVLFDAHEAGNKTDPNSGNMIFDFGSIAFLPREIHSNENNRPGCSPIDLSEYDNTDCEGKLNAILDPCHWPHDQPIPGTDPRGCEKPCFPFSYEYDNDGGNNDGTADEYNHHVWSSWGYDAATWFYQLGEDCMAHWLEKYYCDMDQLDCNGFLQLPGIIVAKPDGQNDAGFRLTDYTNLSAKISEILEVKVPNLIISEDCNWNQKIGLCGPQSIPGASGDPISLSYRREVIARIYNTDCSSSKYQIIITSPNGTIIVNANVSETEEVKFTPSINGDYTIKLIQFNSGIEPTGLREITSIYPYTFSLLACCKDSDGPIAAFGIIISPNPAIDNINLSSTTSLLHPLSIDIINSQGNVVHTTNTISNSGNTTPLSENINIQNLDPGLYYVVCTDANISNYGYGTFIKSN